MRGFLSSPTEYEGWKSGGLATPSAVRLNLPAQPEQIALVRRAIEAVAEERGLPRAMLEDMRLAVTEACTNVVRHAYDAEDARSQAAMRVELRPYQGGMRVIVEDRGRGIVPSPDLEGPGLGLPLIAALTSELDIRQEPGEGSRLAMSFSPAPIEAT